MASTLMLCAATRYGRTITPVEHCARHLSASAGLLQIPVNPSRATLRYRGGMNEDNFSRLPPAAQAYIRELETRNRQLGKRITHLEEQFRLAQSKRFAPGDEQ